MKAVRVNADYESELFHGRPGPAMVNQSLEFLAFFLSDRPVLTPKKYSEIYLMHVESITGRRPETVFEGPYDNWWGELVNVEVERRLNSKLTSAELNVSQNWAPQTYILREMADLSKVPWGHELLLKDPFGMSGKGLQTVRSPSEVKLKGPMILEPLLSRKFDFSHYIFPGGKTICYQNFVDKHFQYRGTVFRDLSDPVLERLSFYSLLSSEKWDRFKEALAVIKGHWASTSGHSIDSFVYEENGELLIRNLSEVNYRRTMGSIAYELAGKYSEGRPWGMLTLARKSPFLRSEDMISALKKLSPEVLLLSPDDVRFQVFLLTARNECEGKSLLGKLKALLPDCEFPIEL